MELTLQSVARDDDIKHFDHFTSPLVAFIHLLGILDNLLQSVNPSVLVSKCSELFASDIHKIALFSTDELNLFGQYNETSMLIKRLRSHWTWYDHSVLKALLESSHLDGAMKLLDDFESHIDYTLPVTDYPISSVNHLMIPDRSSKYTLLATKYKGDATIRYLTLQCLTDLKMKMIRSFGITTHSVQLLAVNHSPIIFYWLIPRAVVPLLSIRSSVKKHSEQLKSIGLTEVAVYPNSMFIVDNNLTVGPLSYLYSQVSRASLLCLHYHNSCATVHVYIADTNFQDLIYYFCSNKSKVLLKIIIFLHAHNNNSYR